MAVQSCKHAAAQCGDDDGAGVTEMLAVDDMDTDTDDDTLMDGVMDGVGLGRMQ